MFHHETLQVYRTALDFMEWFTSRSAGKELTIRLFRQVDEAATSVVLNIAEGNGRYAELDHDRFLKIADSAAIRVAVYLDLCVQKGFLRKEETAVGKTILCKIHAMLA